MSRQGVYYVAEAVTAEATRAARDFLKTRGLLGRGISPRLLAGAKSDFGSKSWAELLVMLADMLDGGQGQGPSPETQDIEK